MLRIGVLASHEGTTLQSIIDACAQGRINGRVVAVISNNSGSGALGRAAAAGIQTFHFSSVTHSTGDSLDVAICGALRRACADVVFLAGYMKRLGPRTLAAFPGRILNTHPALLPKFGGQGMFGDRVFEAVLAAGDSESGASVHLVDAEYDTGAVVHQERVRVLPGDSVESLKARVQACEREAVVNTLAAIASGELVLLRSPRYEKAPASVNIRQSMPERWSDRVPLLRGDLTTLREVAVSDVYTLFTLFSNPAVTAYMAPPPPTLAKFAGFVVWSHHERAEGHGLCFGIVPDGMTTAVGILQVRSLDSTLSSAEWGFVLSAHFWSTGVFFDAAHLLVEFAFTTMHVDRLEAHIALRNRRAQAAVRRLGARPESTLATSSQTGIPRDPEVVWTLREDDWRNRARDSRLSDHDARQRIRNAVEAAQSELRRTESPETVEPYPLFLFDRRRRP